MHGGRDGVTVVHNEAARRFEAAVEGRLAVAEYRRAGEAIVFTHTEVPAALEGRGIANALAHTALERAHDEHLTVIPLCPFFAGYIRRYPEYAALVPEEYRARAPRG